MIGKIDINLEWMELAGPSRGPSFSVWLVVDERRFRLADCWASPVDKGSAALVDYWRGTAAALGLGFECGKYVAGIANDDRAGARDWPTYRKEYGESLLKQIRETGK